MADSGGSEGDEASAIGAGTPDEALRESEERFRLIADSAPVPIWVTKLDRTRGFVNQAYVDFIGAPYDEALAFDWRAIIHPDDAERLVAESIAGEASLKPFTLEGRYRNGDGEWRWLSSRSQPRWGTRGEHIGFIGVAHDVTEAKAAETRLRLSEEQFRTLAGNVPVLCWMAHANGDIYWYNRRWYEYTGATADTQLGRGWESVHDPAHLPRVNERWAHSIATGEPFEMTFPLRGVDGEFRPFLTRVIPVRDDAGAIVRWFGSNTDVASQAAAEARLRELNETLEARVAEETAERLKAEESLRQAQKMEAIGQLTGGIAHDFNNLLTVILSSVDLLKRPSITEEKRARYVDAIGDTARRAAALTGQLLAFARRQPLASETFDAGERIAAMRPVLETMLGARVTLDVALPAERQIVMADPNQFESALINMAVNARDAMADGGALAIALAPCEVTDCIAIAVSDTGEGIAPEHVDQIFEPFYTTKGVGKGTGLGLSQVYGFARQSGGEIAVESEPGKGTTFTLRLPRGRLADEAAAASPPGADCAQRACTILVVEDNADIGHFAARLLEDMGHTVVLEADARGALARVRDGEHFDLVFSDVVMPGALDGLGLARMLREEAPALPVALTTGYAPALAEDAGHGFEVLRKPYSAETLADLIAKATR